MRRDSSYNLFYFVKALTEALFLPFCCGACVFSCPQEALTLKERVSGHAFLSKTNYGPMAPAELNIAEETSGKLVTVVRNHAQQVAEKESCELILIDGAPGIGCPVIASLTGVDLALVVTEPTMSGLHDLERILDVTRHFGIGSVVCINKYDINEENSKRITEFCRQRGVEIVGKINTTPWSPRRWLQASLWLNSRKGRYRMR